MLLAASPKNRSEFGKVLAMARHRHMVPRVWWNGRHSRNCLACRAEAGDRQSPEPERDAPGSPVPPLVIPALGAARASGGREGGNIFAFGAWRGLTAGAG